MKNNRYSISIRHALMLLVFLLGLPSSGFGFTQSFRQDGIWFQFVNAGDKTVEVFGCDKTLAEMSDEERKNRNDGHTSATELFAEWYKNSYLKQPVKKISL